MHTKLAPSGFTMMTVCLDRGPGEKDDVIKYLKSKGAAFPNLLLDEEPDLWQEKLRFNIMPCYYVFSRHGQWTQFKEDIRYEAVEKLVLELLREK